MIKIKKGPLPFDKSVQEKITLQISALQTSLNKGESLQSNLFQKSIYASNEVKNALKEASFGVNKCAYCESLLGSSSYAEVEHYRPKTEIRNNQGVLKPGYWWLAYEWENLLFSCRICNNNKRNSFPLKDEMQRGNVNGNISNESPLIINPCDTDPALHLLFHQHQAIGVTEEGKTTIERLKLNREALLQERMECYETIKLLLILRNSPEANAYKKEIIEKIEQMCNPTARFSAMALTALHSPPPPQ